VGDERDAERRPETPLPSVPLDDASNVLLLGSPMDEQTLRTGLSLAAGDRPAETRLLWVTMLNTSREVVDIWDRHVPVRPERFRILLVGDGLADTDAVDDPAVETNSIPEPNDLTTLGIRLLEATAEWGGDDVAVRLRFDSLTPLLQYVDPRSVAQFLHVLTNRLDTADVTAHFHLDPMAHDSRTVHVLASICDARVEVDADGVSVTHR
jgi:hypothetical protein